MVEPGGDERLVCLESGLHDVLEPAEREVLRIVHGEENGENIDAGAVLFLWQPGAIGLGEPVEGTGEGVEVAGGDLELIHDEARHEQIPNDVDDGRAHDADGGFFRFKLLVNELDRASGISLLDRLADFKDDGGAAQRDQQADVILGDFAALGSEVKIEFFQLVADLLGLLAGQHDEEREGVALEVDAERLGV